MSRGQHAVSPASSGLLLALYAAEFPSTLAGSYEVAICHRDSASLATGTGASPLQNDIYVLAVAATGEAHWEETWRDGLSLLSLKIRGPLEKKTMEC